MWSELAYLRRRSRARRNPRHPPRCSARDFWRDVAAERRTIFAYIGKLCRYLLNRPAAPGDRSHNARLCFGNGLRPDICTAFRERFGLPHILEFYAATESNVAMFNFDSMPGSVGRIPAWMRFKFPFAIVRNDLERGTMLRGPNGFCARCEVDEPGEILGQILDDPSKPSARFEGSADKKSPTARSFAISSSKETLGFRPATSCARPGRTSLFPGSTGDTFRWKGENVSTTHVTEIVCGFEGVLDATVNGVRVPGFEGRAGMAAMVAHPEVAFDFDAFDSHLARHLPEYARPRFLRFQKAITTTSTFKPKKSALAAEGLYPTNGDAVFIFDAEAGAFRLVDAAGHDRLLSGGYKL